MLEKGVQFGQGTLNAWDESRWLVLASLGLAVDSPIDVEQQPLSADQASRVRAAIERRIHERIPTAYLTGEAWLKGYSFIVDPRVIIPRSFLAELLVDRLRPYWPHPTAPLRILDMCTGCGCLAIIAADVFRQAQVTAVDLSSPALEVARLNIQRYELGKRITLVQSDTFQNLDPKVHGPYDLIISNPPYVPERKAAELPPEFKAEPRSALIAADRGMSVVRKILFQAREFLSPRGLIFIEIGHERRAADALMRREFPGCKPHWIRTSEQFDNVFLITPNPHP